MPQCHECLSRVVYGDREDVSERPGYVRRRGRCTKCLMEHVLVQTFGNDALMFGICDPKDKVAR